MAALCLLALPICAGSHSPLRSRCRLSAALRPHLGVGHPTCPNRGKPTRDTPIDTAVVTRPRRVGGKRRLPPTFRNGDSATACAAHATRLELTLERLKAACLG